MIFIETTTFTKMLPNYLSDKEYQGLQTYLMQKPDAGDIVKGSGGVRKVRWASEGKGKSSGVRAIYYWKKPDHEIWMLTIYSNVHEGLAIAPANESSLVAEGAVTRPTGRREYVHVGSTAAVPAADACRSSNRTLSGTGIFSAKLLISKN